MAGGNEDHGAAGVPDLSAIAAVDRHAAYRRADPEHGSVNLARAVLGTVPVEDDGSAYFVVPARRELFFQALDEDGLAVTSMRSGTQFQPGETATCQGCHEPRQQTPVAQSALAGHAARAVAAVRRRGRHATRSVIRGWCSRCWTSTALPATARTPTRRRSLAEAW